jgi:hypothetical protein
VLAGAETAGDIIHARNNPIGISRRCDTDPGGGRRHGGRGHAARVQGGQPSHTRLIDADASVVENRSENIGLNGLGRVAADKPAMRSRHNDSSAIQDRIDERSRIHQRHRTHLLWHSKRSSCLGGLKQVGSVKRRVYEMFCGGCAGIARRHAQRPGHGIGMADHAATHHVFRIADPRREHRDGRRCDPEPFQRRERGYARIVEPNAGIREDDGADTRRGSERTRIKAAMRSGNQHGAGDGRRQGSDGGSEGHGHGAPALTYSIANTGTVSMQGAPSSLAGVRG